MKREGRILVPAPTERGSRASEEKCKGRVLTLSAERSSHVLELRREVAFWRNLG